MRGESIPISQGQAVKKTANHVILLQIRLGFSVHVLYCKDSLNQHPSQFQCGMCLTDCLLLFLLTLTTTSVSTDDVDFSQASLDPATGLMCIYNQGNLQSQLSYRIDFTFVFI